MANQAFIQGRVWRGYSKAAQKLGASFQFYRPGAGVFPGAPLFARLVSLNAEDMKYGKPGKYGKATWYALVDGAGLAAGDYFTGPQGTFFVAALPPLLPILAVECNRTASLCRVEAMTGFGAQGYSGMTADNEKPYAQAVPCSILQGTKGEKPEAGLPADTRLPWWNILLPAAAGNVAYGDIIRDDLGRRYIASSVELTAMGYRITASLGGV